MRWRGPLALALLLSLAAASPAPAATAGRSAGVMSPNVQHITTIPLEQGTATGARLVGRTLFVTSWRSLSIYDVSRPLAPSLLSRTPLGFQFENENVSTNGKILLITEQAPLDRLHVWDVSNPRQPREVSTLLGAGTHTATCIDDCRWAYGSYDFVGPQGAMTGGQLVDLRDPAAPVDAGHYNDGLPAAQTHDVEELSRGRVLTASKPLQLLDVTDPRRPKVLAVGTNDDRRMHSAVWPRHGRDRYLLTSFETNADVRCTATSGEFSTWSTEDWREGRKFSVLDTYRVANGDYLDGRPAANQLGCSAHWFEEHPTFRNGGVVAAAFYEHGVRFLEVSRRGAIKEIGYFMGWGSSASAAYWVTHDVVYSVDYTRGIDVLRIDRSRRGGTTKQVSASTWQALADASSRTATTALTSLCRAGA